MATHAPAAARGGPRFLRVWLPVLIPAAATLLVTALWAWPDVDWSHERRVTYTWITVFVAGLGLLAWFILWSGLPWTARITFLLLVAGGLFASIRQVKFTGDMEPIITFRWDPTHDEVVEAHRQRQAGAGPVAAVAFSPDKAPPYAEYRGSRRDGVIVGPALNRDWAGQPPRELWGQSVGGGYAGIVVRDNLAVTLEQRRDEEAVVGYDTATGHELWKHRHEAHFQESTGGPGPRATPTIAGDRVYALGATGVLVCLDAATGKLQWRANTLEGNENIPWGMAGSPLVYDQVVVVNPGSQTEATKGRALVAYDRATGKQVWAAGSHKASYSSPMLATLAGRRQVLVFDAAGLGGHDPETGRELWRFPWVTNYEVNAAQPVVLDGDRVFLSSGYGHGCAMVKVNEADGKWTAQELWQTRSMHCKFTSPVLYQGHLYGLDEGILVCLDPATGQRKWKDGRYGHGQLLLAGDLLVIFAEDGRLALVEAAPDAYREVASRRVFGDRKNWNHLALAEGKAYLRNHLEMACLDLR